MTKKVLIITNSFDLHADQLTPILAAKGHQAFRLNLDAFPRDYQLSQVFDGGHMSNKIRMLPDGAWLDLAEVAAIWTRKTSEFSYLSEDLSLHERTFAKQETEQALFGLLFSLDCYWMNHPLASRGAMWKGEQLMRATQMGFRVPRSIVTNCPDQVRNFKNSLSGDMIFKSMSSPYLGGETLAPEQRITGGVGTTIVDPHMMDSLDAVRQLACHFQEYIVKQYELRVTVIGERVFAAKIHSQDDARTTVDSRNMSAEIAYEATQLPPALAKRCVDFVHNYGLNFGALDLIITPDGEAVFLENNPGGQFLYVEQLIPEFKMLDALADKLIEELQCR